MNKQVTYFDKVFTIKGLKKEIEKVENFFWKYNHIKSYLVETYGLFEREAEQHTSECITLFTENEVKDFDVYIEKYKELFFNQIKGEEITLSDCISLSQKGELKALFSKHVCFIDKREHEQERIEKNLKNQEYQIINNMERQLEELKFGLHDENGDKVTKEDNQMFVYIEAYFDDSDAMTDYFHRHASISSSYALAVVNTKQQRESTVRNILNQIPELNKYKWEWKTENYSMGHGNYLESEYIGTIKHNAYNGRKEVGYRFQIEFSNSKELPKSRYFIDLNSRTNNEQSESNNTESNKDKIVRKNEEKNGVEIKFSSKPSDEILSKLKSNGFRWSKFSKVWYCKYSEKQMEFANNI